jgi:SEC-C motif
MLSSRIAELVTSIRALSKTAPQLEWSSLATTADLILNETKAGDDEPLANAAWFLKEYLNSHYEYLVAFEEIKAGEYYKAWCRLERVEITLRDMMRNPIVGYEEFGPEPLFDLVARWQSLYPYNVFFSPEIFIKRETCSICGQVVDPWTDCGHRRGLLYKGEICHLNVTDCEFKRVSIVADPVQKFSVAFTADEEGNRIDQYDYAPVKFVADRLTAPFDGWSMTWTYAYHPHSMFPSASPDGPCPCGSGKKYATCCLHEPGVKRPHMQVTFETCPHTSLSPAELAGYGDRNGPASLHALDNVSVTPEIKR